MEIATFICIVLLNVGLVVSTFHNRRQDKRIEKLQEAVVLLMTKPEPKKPVYNYTVTNEIDSEELVLQLKEYMTNHEVYATPKRYILNADIADIKTMFEKMPKKEADQLADVIQLHGDKITGPVVGVDDFYKTNKKDDNNE